MISSRWPSAQSVSHKKTFMTAIEKLNSMTSSRWPSAKSVSPDREEVWNFKLSKRSGDLPSKSDPQITSKMGFIHNWPRQDDLPCQRRHCCIDLDQLYCIGRLGSRLKCLWHPSNSIQKYCWRCSPKKTISYCKNTSNSCAEFAWVFFGTIPTGQCSKIWETIDGGDSYPSPKLGEHRVFWKVSVVDSYIFQSSWWFQLSIYLHHWYVVKFDHFPGKNALRIVETT